MVSKSTISVVMQICSHLIRNAHWRVNSTDSVSSATRVLNQHWCLQLIPSQFKHNPSACRASRYDPHRHTHLPDRRYCRRRSQRFPDPHIRTRNIANSTTTPSSQHQHNQSIDCKPTHDTHRSRQRIPVTRLASTTTSTHGRPASSPTQHGTPRRHSFVKIIRPSVVKHPHHAAGSVGTNPRSS